MKTRKVTRKLANLLYLLLVCVIGVGCNKTKVEYNEREKCLEFETKEAIVLNINTEGFKLGDVLAVGDSGKLVLAKPEDIDRIVGIVTKPNRLKLFIRKVKSIQKEFEKGYTATDTIQGVELDEFIKDHSKYYKMILWGSLDGVNYYCADTIFVKDGEVLIYKGRAGNAR